ncbi:MAG: hypothetical protein JXQ65_13050 [Candidatus Marinimicrobia bacterium]|nr:hypothetical protein [Candidatus Neomarinimicrobiota bacterium]
MKMIYCIYNVSVAEVMEHILQNTNEKNFQVYDNVLAKTAGSLPRFNTPVWPGYNQTAMVQTEDETNLIKAICAHNLRESDVNEQILVYSWTIEQRVG